MTQSTEQERAEFEAWKEDYALTFEPNYDEHLEADCRAAFLAGMQAARRAPVVPQGWKLVPEESTEAMARAFRADDAPYYFAMTTIRCNDFAERWRAVIAAAPQPPEVAPVQMPEPDIQKLLDSIEEYGRASFDHGLNIVERINAKQSDAVFRDAHALWEQCQSIQHQVRQLLAASGIK